MFLVNKAAVLAQVAISTADGISSAVEEYGPNPIGFAAARGLPLV